MEFIEISQLMNLIYVQMFVKITKLFHFFSFDEECKNNIKDKIDASCTDNINKYCTTKPYSW
jgi:hypothetical protein